MFFALVMTGGKCSTKTSDHLLLFSQDAMETAVHPKPVHKQDNLKLVKCPSHGKHFGCRWYESGRRIEELCFLLQAASGQLSDSIVSEIEVRFQVILNKIKLDNLVPAHQNQDHTSVKSTNSALLPCLLVTIFNENKYS